MRVVRRGDLFWREAKDDAAEVEEECPSVIKNGRKRFVPDGSNPIEFRIGNGDSIVHGVSA
jgi:hypothetical protein